VRQILVNIAANGIKFTERGEITLSARIVEGDAVEFEVRDTGIGIAPEDLERIFDPFWQVEQAATRKVGGTGLGLSVSQRLAHLLGGGVTVQSEEGKGSRFVLRLPLRVATA
jgi:signal transduction histidine kinase